MVPAILISHVCHGVFFLVYTLSLIVCLTYLWWSHPPSFDNLNNTWQIMQIIMLPIIKENHDCGLQWRKLKFYSYISLIQNMPQNYKTFFMMFCSAIIDYLAALIVPSFDYFLDFGFHNHKTEKTDWRIFTK